MKFPASILVSAALFLAPHLASAQTTPTPAPERVFYAGNAGAERFNTLLELSNGTILVGGVADNLDWIAPATPRIQLNASAIHNAQGTGKIAFLAQLNADMSQILRVFSLPRGAAENIRALKTNTKPGDATGSIWVSGTTLDTRQNEGGYFIARLNSNCILRQPTAFSWVKNVWATGDHQTIQPWDVGRDGKVVYATGQPFGYDWCAVMRLKNNGLPDVVPQWRYHWTTANQQVIGPLSDKTGIAYSALVFKTTGRIDLRSWTDADYQKIHSDGNGGTKKGLWPMDYYFSGPGNPLNPGASPGGAGYTGYRLGASPTQRVGAIAVDRISGAVSVGFSTQSRLPDGNPDFEPAVISFSREGALKWWSRLYTETSQNSTPDQYVDGLTVDYSNNCLVVLARCHGNNVPNLWNGIGSFHNGFTGTQGNIHISWLGKLDLRSGTLWKSCFVAEYEDGMSGTGAPYADAKLDGWPDHNSGWANLNTTRCANDIKVDKTGRVYLLGVGRRTITTSDAYQKMIKKAEGSSSWNNFARVYASDLSTLVYSSLLIGQWDKTMGAGGDNTNLWGICPTTNGVLVAGWQTANKGNPVPTVGAPTWGSTLPDAESALIGRLLFNQVRAAPLPAFKTSSPRKVLGSATLF